MAGHQLTTIIIAGALAVGLGLSPNPADAIHRFIGSMLGQRLPSHAAPGRLKGQRWFAVLGALLIALGLILAISQ